MVRIRDTARVNARLMSAVLGGVSVSAKLSIQLIAIIPMALCTLLADQAKAASINTEASSPQGPTRAAVRPAVAKPVAARATTVSIPIIRPTRAAPRVAPTPASNGLVRRAIATNTPINRAPGTANRSDDGVPDQSWGGPRINTPAAAIPRAQVRQVNVPVLGREGPAARITPARVTPAKAPLAKPPIAPPVQRSISITASEPTLTSMVRPQDVAGFQKIGAPYQVNGTWYVPAHEPDYDETGIASWYGADFQGRPTANGEIFDMNVVSGAHPTLPIPSLVEVTNLTNGRSIVVRVNDRGPFMSSRLIDMSARGAELLGFKQEGHTNVRVRYVGPADIEPMVTAENISTGRASVVAQATPPAGPAFVQVGAFAQLANAERLRDQATSLGPVRVVETSQADGNPLYRVVLGPVSSRMEADVKAQEMSTNGFTGARVLASLN
jgi:rare lipoprotein A